MSNANSGDQPEKLEFPSVIPAYMVAEVVAVGLGALLPNLHKLLNDSQIPR
jgi:hypothetical protein